MSAGTMEMLFDRVDGIADIVRAGASESEALGHLAPSVVAALHDADLFRLLVPVELGGHGLTIPEAIAVFERMAALDASTGWTLSILGTGPVLVRNLSPAAFTTICTDPLGLVAGGLNPSARAEVVDGGYIFRGRATYLSGFAHARWVTVGAIVFDGDEPVVTDGLLEIRTGTFPVELADDLDTWHVTGMRATGSTDIEFDNVRIEKEWTFEPLRPRVPGPDDDVFARIPINAQLGGGLAAVAVGAARNMIDRFSDLAAVKVPAGGNFTRLAERPSAQSAVGRAEGLYQAAHAVLHDTVRGVWARGEAHEPFDNEVLGRQRAGVMTAVQLAAEAIDILHDVSGMNAVLRDSILDRCWRDVHTMTQHVLLAPPRFEIVGRVLLGLDPGGPII